jgi:hypothetical protein
MDGLSAAQEILLAAAELSDEGRSEFSEWDLSVRAWTRNRNRFGCRGYERRYPDHKRVMGELIGPSRPLIARGWLEKTRANHFHVTPLGRAEARRLTGDARPAHRREAPLYDALARFAFHRAFEAHLASPDEPRTWLGAAAFLALPTNDPNVLDRRLTTLRTALREAEKWMRETGQTALRRGDGGRAISLQRVAALASFVQTLEKRFANQFGAIRSGAAVSRERMAQVAP